MVLLARLAELRGERPANLNGAERFTEVWSYFMTATGSTFLVVGARPCPVRSAQHGASPGDGQAELARGPAAAAVAGPGSQPVARLVERVVALLVSVAEAEGIRWGSGVWA